MSVVKKKIISKSDHIGFFGVTVNPSFSVSAAALTFGLTMLRDITVAQQIMVSGVGLTNPIVITAPAGFIINTDNSNTNQSPISLAPSTGSVNASVYVKFAPTLYQAHGPVNITAACTGLTTQNIAVSGTVDLQTDLKAFYNALTGAKPNATTLYGLQGLLTQLENTGQLANLDLFHVLIGFDTDEQRTLPFKTTGATPFSLNGSYTFDNQGFRGDGSTGYIGLEWNADGDGITYQKDDACYCFYSASTAGIGGSGSEQTARSKSYIYPRKPDGSVYYAINNAIAGGDERTGLADAKGLYCTKRIGVNSPVLHKNGTVLDSGSKTSAIRNNIEEYLGAINTSSGPVDFSDHRYCVVAYGNSTFDDSLLFALLTNYASEIGVTI